MQNIYETGSIERANQHHVFFLLEIFDMAVEYGRESGIPLNNDSLSKNVKLPDQIYIAASVKVILETIPKFT